MKARLLFMVCIAALVSCYSPGEVSPPQDDVETPADVIAGDAGAPTDVIEVEVPIYRVLIRTLTPPREVEPGVATGFDLDGRVSDGTAPDECGVEDFTAPDGTPGIDNQMAILTPLFEMVGFGDVSAYFEKSIEDSGFFHLFELRGAESLVDDDSVELIYESGGGSGLMDPEGDLVAHQTMCVQDDSPHVIAAEASITGGILRARFEDLTITFSMFERIFPYTFIDLHLSARLTADGTFVDGVMGGTLINLMEMVAKASEGGGAPLEPMQQQIERLADMSTDEGQCTGLSTCFDFIAVPVFFYPPDSDCDPCGNDTCDYFESCETCLIDCCAGCGNDTCDFIATAEHAIIVSAQGFETPAVDVLVGDTIVWTNQTDGPINLICEDLFGSHSIEPTGTYLAIATTSGTYSCRVHEQPGQLNVLHVDDSHSETCVSCPQDCGDCPPGFFN